jgi:hypothetical protein
MQNLPTCVHMCTESKRVIYGHLCAHVPTVWQSRNTGCGNRKSLPDGKVTMTSRGDGATSSPSGNESGNLRRQRVRAVWPLRVEEQCGACLTRRGIRAASSLLSRNEPQHKNFESNTQRKLWDYRYGSVRSQMDTQIFRWPMFSKETPCKLSK